MSGDGSVLDFWGPLADHHLGCDVSPRGLAGPGPRHPQGAPAAQAGDQLALQRSAALHIEGLVDRFMGDPHGLIIGEIDPQTVRDLLWAPGLHPAAVATMRLVLAVPLRTLGAQHPAIGCPDPPRQAVLDIAAEPVVGGELGRLGPPSAALGMPLGDRRFVLDTPGPRRRVPTQLPRDRRRAPAQPAGDLAHADTLGPIQRNLFALAE